MRIDPLNVSPRFAGAVTGLGFAVAFGVIAGIASPGDQLGMAAVGLISGALIGLTTGISVRRLQRRLAPAVVGLSPEAAKDAFKRSQGGVLPTDPAVRLAALGIAARQLASMLRYRIVLWIVAVCLAVPIVLSELDDDVEWWRPWPGVVVLLFIGAQLYYRPRLLRRRIAVLRDAAVS
jgi:hypothetical protein